MKYPDNEEARLAALALYKILDTDEEQIYDDLTKLAAYIAQTPIALISIVDRKRTWFKSRIGMSGTENQREQSFCGHAILQPREPFVIPDATQDERFSSNPLVTGSPGIRFYFGAALVTSDNYALGSLCVIDTNPRELTAQQIELLTALARQVTMALDIRKNVYALGNLLGDQTSRLNSSARTLDEVDRLTNELVSVLRKKQTSNEN